MLKIHSELGYDEKNIDDLEKVENRKLMIFSPWLKNILKIVFQKSPG